MEHMSEDCQCEGKKCTKCKEMQCVKNYTKDPSQKSGLRPSCRSCATKQAGERRANNREYHNYKRRKRYQKKNQNAEPRKREEDWLIEHREELMHVFNHCRCIGKQCTKCKKIFCIENYAKDNRLKSGLSSHCKICISEANKKWREGNKEYDRERTRQYYQTERGRESQRRNDQRPERKARKKVLLELKREETREIREARALKRQEERESRRPLVAERRRTRAREYQRKNSEINRIRWKSYYQANKQYHYDRVRQWQKEHPDGHAAIQARRRTRKTQAGGSYTEQEWHKLKQKYNHTCLRCKRSEPEIKLTADHIIPITKGGSSNIDNIQPLCGSCNTSKGTKVIDFRPQNP